MNCIVSILTGILVTGCPNDIRTNQTYVQTQKPENNALWGETLPRNPVVKDCIHVHWPACSGGN